MSNFEALNQQSKMLNQVQKLQSEALRRARNLHLRTKSAKKPQHEVKEKYKSAQKVKIFTPEKRYSIEKVHEQNQIDFLSQFILSKELTRKNHLKLKLQKYQFQHPIGYGAFSKVYKVEDRTTHRPYAIKEINKSLVIASKGIASIMNERNLATQVQHPLVPSLLCSFQTVTHLYLVLPLMEKGDLRYHITKFKQFQEKEVRFFIACLVSVLEYLHIQCGVLHRDIKPENLLLDQAGYLHLSDFGIAHKLAPEASCRGCCGTPAYMAPEVLFDKQYTFTADYYALGVLVYEMMIGCRPYLSSDREQLRHMMSRHSASIRKDSIPQGWSVEAADFANRLLHRNPANRLGQGGIREVKGHPWLRDFPWERLARRQLVSPYCESFNHWEAEYRDADMGGATSDMADIEAALERGELQELFRCFTYDGLEKSAEYTTKPSLQMRI